MSASGQPHIGPTYRPQAGGTVIGRAPTWTHVLDEGPAPFDKRKWGPGPTPKRPAPLGEGGLAPSRGHHPTEKGPAPLGEGALAPQRGHGPTDKGPDLRGPQTNGAGPKSLGLGPHQKGGGPL